MVSLRTHCNPVQKIRFDAENTPPIYGVKQSVCDVTPLLELPALPTTLTGLIVWIIGLVILWVVISIPVYFAGKIINEGRAHFGQAMGATLGGGLAYFIVFYGVVLLLGPSLGASAALLGLVLALVIWLAVYRASFDTSWTRALGIVIVAWLLLLVLDFILIAVVGVGIPKFYPF